MNYKTIVVSLDNSKNLENRLSFAISLALEHGAHLVGMHLSQYFVPYISYDGVAVLIAEIEGQVKIAQDKAKLLFETMTKKFGISASWLAFDSRNEEIALLHARSADLMIIEQNDKNDDDSFVMEDFPESFVLGTGKPILLLPSQNQKQSKVSFENIAIAWSGERESARAVADALPWLKKAKNVYVLYVDSKDKSLEAQQAIMAIEAYLKRHEVHAQFITCESPHSRSAIGQSILAKAVEHQADLVVMGAYGHSRLTELMLGGVTRTILQETLSLPVFMSH
ncbi:MAG: universal stress protein [Pseudomonadota bacterium]